jgi:hypothetical protein
MKFQRLFVGMFAATLVSTGPAHADTRAAADEIQDYMRQYAECMVLNEEAAALKLVASTIDAVDMGRDFPGLVARNIVAVPSCHRMSIRGGIAVSFDGEPLRFALAQQLVRFKWAEAGPVDFAAVPPLPKQQLETKAAHDSRVAAEPSSKRRAELEEVYAKSIATAWLFNYGECVVRREPAAAREWALSSSKAAGEGALVRRLAPAFGACLDEGESLNFDRELLRGTVAVNYVRLASAAAPGHAPG